MMRRIAKEAEIEISVRIALALLIGLPLSHLLGWTGTLTISFAIILVTYLNRGFYGARTYYVKRMQTQVLMCILLYFIMRVLQTYTTLPVWVMILIAEVPVAAFVYYLFFGWNFAPMNLSPIVGPMMIMNTALKNPDFYTWRVVFTFIGVVIGWGITIIYPFSGKVLRAERSMEHLAEFLSTELNQLRNTEDFLFSKEHGKAKGDLTYEWTEINTYLALVYSEINTPKYRKYINDVPRIKALQGAVGALIGLTDTISAQAGALKAEDKEFQTAFLTAVEEVAAAYHGAVAGDMQTVPAFMPLPLEMLNGTSRMALASAIIKCRNQVTALYAAKGKTAENVLLAKEG